MNLQQLRYFVAISQFGHYGQAAKALYVTQSALSNSIKKLEGELGVRLFEHQGRNAVLTDRGKVFAARITPFPKFKQIRKRAKINQGLEQLPLLCAEFFQAF